MVYQDYRLIKELNVWENVALPLYIAGKKESEIEQRVSDLLTLVKLPDKHELFPAQLSGGEAQRISIARSLALAPELIFADEPTGNLDTDTTKQIALLLAKINELGTTVLLSTHDLSLLEIFTNERHLRLEKGAVVSDTGSKRGNTAQTEPESKDVTPDMTPVATSMGIQLTIDKLTDESEKKDAEKDSKDNRHAKPEEADSDEGNEGPKKTELSDANLISKRQPRKLWHRLSLKTKQKKSKE